MYTDFFGLTQRPFGSNAAGERVFVGPQQVKIISALGKALAGDDTIVTLSGRIGTGKSTIINRVLETVAKNRAVARIGRLKLGPDEVLELLLTEFGVTELPPGTIQRYNAFKNLLKDWEQSGTRSFIVVEDAKHAGLDALLELEAITSSDSGDSPGACILLMGGLDLDDFLRSSQLDRLRQRLRRRTTLDPCTEAEVQGYLAHCFRVAGKDIDEILEPGAARMLYRLSEGIPRVINNICETALIAAPGHNMRRLTPKFLEIVALEVFGVVPKNVELEESETDVGAKAREQEKEPAAQQDTAAEAPDEPVEPAAADETQKSAESSPEVEVSKKTDQKVAPQTPRDRQRGVHQLVVESGFAPNVVHSSDAAKKAAKALHGDSDDSESLDYDEIPEFIEDTLPSVKELSLADQEIDAHDAAEAESPIAAVASLDDEIEPAPQAGETGSSGSGFGDLEPRLPAKPVDESADSTVAASDHGEAQNQAMSRADDAPEIAAVSNNGAQNGAGLDIESTQPQKTLKLQDADGGAVQTSPPEVGKSFDPRNTVPDVENIPTLSDSMRVAVPQDAADDAATGDEAVQGKNEKPAAAVAHDGAKAEPETVHEDTAVRAAMEIDHALISQMEEEQFAAATADSPTVASPAADLRLQEATDAGESDALAAAISVACESVPAKDQEALNQAMIERSAAALAPDLGPDNQPDREVDLDEWADELGKAEALAEIDDVMAETLFGTVEASKISAEIVSDAAAGSLQAEDPVALDFVDIPDGAPLYPAAVAPGQSSNGAAQSPAADAAQETNGANAAASQYPTDAQVTNSDAPAAGDAPSEQPPPPVAGARDDQDEDDQSGRLGLFKRASKHQAH